MGANVKVLKRGVEEVRISNAEWANMLNFLAQNGLQLSKPMHGLLGTCEVSDNDASILAEAFQIIQEETMKDPLSAYQAITFDMGKFAEIAVFLEDGSFTITNA